MARFAIANLNEGELDGTRILPPAAYDEMWSPQAESPWAEMFGPPLNAYGLGWWVGDFNGHPVMGNYGAEVGFQSHLALFPDDDMAVIALVNLYDPDAGAFYAYDMGNAISDVLWAERQSDQSARDNSETGGNAGWVDRSTQPSRRLNLWIVRP
ncbi:MAG: serine hydrolase [Caldilineales bacterium]